MASSVRDALTDAGIEVVEVIDRAAERELRDEIKRLTKIVSKQSGERRRLAAAYAKLKDEKRSTAEMIGIAEQLQDEVEALEAKVETYESGAAYRSLDGARENARRSREALSVRYGVLHRALTALLADPSARDQAEEALRLVEDTRWVRAQMEDTPR